MLVSCGLQRSRRGHGLRGVDFVGRAKTDEVRRRCLAGGGEGGSIGKPLAVDDLDSAAFEKALCKGRARGEVGGAAEIGKEDRGPLSLLLQDLIGAVAQTLER